MNFLADPLYCSLYGSKFFPKHSSFRCNAYDMKLRHRHSFDNVCLTMCKKIQFLFIYNECFCFHLIISFLCPVPLIGPSNYCVCVKHKRCAIAYILLLLVFMPVESGPSALQIGFLDSKNISIWRAEVVSSAFSKVFIHKYSKYSKVRTDI